MRPPADAVVTTGSGPDLLLVHGTAVDGGSWGNLPRLLGDRFRVTRYHRRGTERWPVHHTPTKVDDHVEDLVDVIRNHGTGPVYLHGASFGAAIVLELCCRHPELVRGATLFEPSVAAGADPPPVAAAFLADFERMPDRQEAAAERFHRRVLGDAAWRLLPAESRMRARAMWPHIRGDLRANVAHRLSQDALARINVPVLLLEGRESGRAFAAPLRLLADALPRVQRRVLESAGHRVGPRGGRELADAIAGFVAG